MSKLNLIDNKLLQDSEDYIKHHRLIELFEVKFKNKNRI